jgi:spore maturation protein SpmB
LLVAFIQRIRIFDPVLLAYMAGILFILGGLVYITQTLPQEQMSTVVGITGNLIILSIIIAFISLAFYRKVDVYETFIEGAKEGFSVAVKIIPYLVAMLVGIGLLRSSGTMSLLTDGLTATFAWMGIDTTFTGALPVGLMKPLSGSGARGLMVDAMTAYGPDSFVGRLACIINGSTDTTFYILALYFGSVGIRNTRYAVVTGLIADLVGLTLSVIVAYLFFT